MPTKEQITHDLAIAATIVEYNFWFNSDGGEYPTFSSLEKAKHLRGLYDEMIDAFQNLDHSTGDTP
jgi:hypothetical protein